MSAWRVAPRTTSIPSRGLRTEQRLGRRSGRTAKQRQKRCCLSKTEQRKSGRGLATDERRKGTCESSTIAATQWRHCAVQPPVLLRPLARTRASQCAAGARARRRPLEQSPQRPGTGAAWEGYSGPLLAVGIGRGSHGASPACTSTHELRACTAGRLYLKVRTAKAPNARWLNGARAPAGSTASNRQRPGPAAAEEGNGLQRTVGMCMYVCSTAGLLICTHM